MKEPIKLEGKLMFSPAAKGELKSLGPVLKQLTGVHETYINAEPEGDFTFLHGERSQVGLLDVAAFCARKTALEEYPIKKKLKQRGRSDLYIRTDGTTTFDFEAKALRNVNLHHRKKGTIKRICDGLNRAMRDAREHIGSADRHVALCFVAPWINEKWSLDLWKRWNQVIAELNPVNGRRHCDALLWIRARQPLPGEHRLYPGLIVAVKQVGKS